MWPQSCEHCAMYAQGQAGWTPLGIWEQSQWEGLYLRMGPHFVLVKSVYM